MYVGVTRQGLPGAGLAPQSPKKQKGVDKPHNHAGLPIFLSLNIKKPQKRVNHVGLPILKGRE